MPDKEAFMNDLANLVNANTGHSPKLRADILALVKAEHGRDLLAKVGLHPDSLDVLGKRSPQLRAWVADKLPYSGFLPPQLTTFPSSKFSSIEKKAIGEQALSTLWACLKLDMFDTLALYSLRLFVETTR